MDEGKFSTEHNKPSPEGIEAHTKAEWAEHGAFVPAELLSAAQEIFDRIHEVPASFQDLSQDKREKYVEFLRAYIQIPSYGEENNKKRKTIRDEVKKLFR